MAEDERVMTRSRSGLTRPVMVLDSDSDVENQPPPLPPAASSPTASPTMEEVRAEMQRDDSFDLSVFKRKDEEEDSTPLLKEIADEDIDNLPDIDTISFPISTPNKNSVQAVVLPRKAPIAVVAPTSRIVSTPSHASPLAPPRLPLEVSPVHSYSSGMLANSTRHAVSPQIASALHAQPSTSKGPDVNRRRRRLPLDEMSPACSTGRGMLTNSMHPAGAPRVSPVLQAQASTSKGLVVNRKRSHSISIYDSHENHKLKKGNFDSLDDSLNDSFDNSADLDDTDIELNASDRESNGYDTETEMNSDEEAEYTRLNDIMPFPSSVGEINFDVGSISKLPQKGFDLRSMGDKKYNAFLRERALTQECLQEMYNSLKETPDEQTEMPDPRGLTVRLMPHQKQGLKWMMWREQRKPSGGILADDMGLGKTLQTIALVLAEKNEKNQNTNEDDGNDSDDDWGLAEPNKIYDGKTLVVCLASLIRQWEKEIRTKCKRDQLRVYVYHGTSRQISVAKLAKYDIVITTYNLVMREYELDVAPKKNKDSRIFKIHWQRVVLDEAHYIRNRRSKMSKAACELRANRRWVLTGTPIQNKEADFYALLKFLKCSPFDEITVWKKWVTNRSASGNQRLIVITKTLMLRRTKQELQEQNLIQKLPDKQVSIIKVHLDKDERIAYQKLLLYSQTFFDEFLRQRKDKEHLKEFGCHMRPNLIAREVPDKMSKMLRLLMRHHKDIGTHYILVLILRLRQMCCHPALIKAMLDQEEMQQAGLDASKENSNFLAELSKVLDEEDDDEEDGFDIDASMAKRVMTYANPVFSNTRKSSKVKQVLKIVDSILEKGEKVIVVSQWTGFLKVIASNLHSIDGARFATFSGGVNVKERQLILDRLNDRNDSLNVLLLSLTAGGVGLNLVGANNLLLIDLHWNPQLETQAQDRIYRFGQENNVHIYKFICVDTIEEKIKQLQDEKLKIAHLVLTGKVNNALTIEDLKLLFS